MAAVSQPLNLLRVIDPAGTNFVRGAGRLMWAGTTIAFPTQLSQIVDLTVFNPAAGWNDFGATKTGIQVSLNNTEEAFDVDQILTDLITAPVSWEMNIATSLAEPNLSNFQLSWEAGDSATTSTSAAAGRPLSETNIGMGAALFYTQRRLAVLFQRPDGRLRGFAFRKVQRSPQQSQVTYNKTGEQQSIPVQFKCLPDTSIVDPKARFGVLFEQNLT